MIVIAGKTCSGKDTITDNLIKEYGYKKIVTYTTRPPRKGEKDGITYHFISNEEFKDKISNGFFAEWKSYETVSGTWYYGSSVDDLKMADNKNVIILTPKGYKDVWESLGYKPLCIYVYANDMTIKKRLIGRGDDKAEANRRVDHDRDDFKGFENIATKIVYNNDGTDLNEVIKKVLKYVGGIN